MYCSCKGIRVCKICENDKVLIKKDTHEIIDITKYLLKKDNIEYFINFESLDNKNFFNKYEQEVQKIKNEINIDKNEIKFNLNNIFEGFYILKNFLNIEESKKLIEDINSKGWVDSQSGRKKQDYGPKINYKKRKVKYQEHNFPAYYDEILKDKISDIDFLKDFKTAEIGNLLYSPKLGSCIDPHIDDYWIWGRIIGINLQSKCVFTFSLEIDKVILEINLPIDANDAYVMTGSSRYIWKHSIKRENITDERVAITLREYESQFKINKI
jgi:alkylated DNA repair protein alkB family protein 4